MTRIQMDLPDAIAQDAQAAGLLTPQALERLLSDALRTRSLTALDSALEKLAAEPLPPMSEDEIQAEIEAFRAEKRAAARS
jgi:hypothetical protein